MRRVKTRCAEVRVVGRVEKSREEVKRVELRGRRDGTTLRAVEKSCKN